MSRRAHEQESTPQAAPARRRRARQGRLLAVALSLAGHLSIVLGLFLMRAQPPKPAEPVLMMVGLIGEPRLAPAPTPAAQARPSHARPAPRRGLVRPAPARRDIDPLPANLAASADMGSELSEAQLAGAASAESVPPGRHCDIARSLQAALRNDPLVQTATAGSAGKALMVWNGDWVRSRGEDGKGLAAVREAIMWEIAFAPKACRTEPVRGLVLISMNPAPGAARLALGSAEWRWADLLAPGPNLLSEATPGR